MHSTELIVKQEEGRILISTKMSLQQTDSEAEGTVTIPNFTRSWRKAPYLWLQKRCDHPIN